MNRQWLHIHAKTPVTPHMTMSVVELDDDNKITKTIAKTWELDSGEWAWSVDSDYVPNGEEFSGTEDTRESARMRIALALSLGA